ncbi:hypothetical protein LJR175_007623 [Variovorax sp. LjRoot175]|uniref:hypothetical protein n=1 Tax=Variovorax sp. LjRoot175 TaxID=3342276 RepID=UPI003ED01B97
MNLIIEARLVDDLGETARAQLATIDRELTTSPLGLSLAEGKALLAAAQQYFVDGQCQGIAAAHSFCEHCESRLSIKGWHQRQIRTAFGRVTVRSPRGSLLQLRESGSKGSENPGRRGDGTARGRAGSAARDEWRARRTA